MAMTIEVAGETVQVELTQGGRVEGTFRGQQYSAVDVAALREKLKKVGKQSAAPVEVLHWELPSPLGRRHQAGLQARCLLLIGTHAIHGHPLLRDPKTRKAVAGSNGWDWFLTAVLSAEEQERGRDLHLAWRAAEEAWRAWRERHARPGATLLEEAGTLLAGEPDGA